MKKLLFPSILVVSFFLTHNMLHQSVAQPATSKTVGTNKGGDLGQHADGEIFAIIAVEPNKSWSLVELRQSALSFLIQNGSMPKDTTVKTRVIIRPHSTNIMCQFDFSQGFGKPFWVVDIGYDAKVTKFEKRIAREGGLGGPDPGRPQTKPVKE